LVSGPNGFSAFPVFQSVDVNTNGAPRTATYRFTPPGGSWDASKEGTYTVSVGSNQVFDTASPPNVAKVGPIGKFIASFPRNYIVDNIADENDGDTSPGRLSLREAVGLANVHSPAADTISFDPTLFAVPRT